MNAPPLAGHFRFWAAVYLMKNVYSKTEPVLVPCETNYSFFFDFVAPELPGINTAPLHRICTLMRKMGVKCFTREELQHEQEIAEEVEALSLRSEANFESRVVRFTFFRRAPTSDSYAELGDNDILGYAVLL